MFRKLLIANRGEIACRIISTAKRLGVSTVAVYSEADRNAKHVAMADEAVHIGPAPAADSYLSAERIIEAASQSGAQAIHPGYGFLSENPEFAEAVEAAGLHFIGPPASAIRAMGLKDAAKARMEQAGVPIVPGYHGADQTADLLATEADNIGYPVLIKARAGGGGKGMRLVENPADFREALQGAQREAQASFGDPACLIEKYITQPRHIEIQVFADDHGNVVHIFERDCSLQRRHQKVIEEAPAPDMPEMVREAMGHAAVEAARAIGYRGAGTVEFIADGSGPLRDDGFWFMEMNTRLQVEHPVSEAISGLDFIELQLRIASGEALPFTQDDLCINGHAFEARIYAEDVPKGFLPATGKLDYLAFPRSENEGNLSPHASIRIDSGVRQGDEISPWYDPMIAKLIVHGPTRATALNRLTAALAECHITGAVTNLAFLTALTRHEGFASGKVDTGLIGRDLDTLTAIPAAPSWVVSAVALVGSGLMEPCQSSDPWDILTGWQHWGHAQQYVTLHTDDQTVDCQITLTGKDNYSVTANDKHTELSCRSCGSNDYAIHIGGLDRKLTVIKEAKRITAFNDGNSYTFQLADRLTTHEDDQAADDAIIAPMPGLIKVLNAGPGQTVNAGDVLVILEAMKMEHSLTASRDGVVAEVAVSADEQVQDGSVLLTLEPEHE